MKPLLFAYGTLITGALEPDVRALLRRSCRIGEPARVEGLLLDLGAYPGALPLRGGWIHGRLIELRNPDRCLRAFDRYEGFRAEDPASSLYLRERVEARRESGPPVECWIYWLRRRPARATVIDGGDWVAYANSRLMRGR